MELPQSLIQEIKLKLQDKKISFRESVLLSSLCPFKIGGKSPLVVEPQNRESLEEFLRIAEELSFPFKTLGGGSNLLISDTPNDFIVLHPGGEFKSFYQEKDGGFYIGSSCNTTPTFRKISLMGYTGAEFLSTIPGWVGGAVIQNAGCYGGELFDSIEYVDCIQSYSFKRIKKENIKYGYRYTQFLESKNSIITGIKVKLKEGKLGDIEESLKEKREKRNSSQPENKKSAGSVFKNPNGSDEFGNPIKSWKLIDNAGLRGLSKGGALISPEHCNFIVNTGNARASDVDYLIQIIKEKVYKTSGILLKEEIEYFGTIP